MTQTHHYSPLPPSHTLRTPLVKTGCRPAIIAPPRPRCAAFAGKPAHKAFTPLSLTMARAAGRKLVGEFMVRLCFITTLLTVSQGVLRRAPELPARKPAARFWRPGRDEPEGPPIERLRRRL